MSMNFGILYRREGQRLPVVLNITLEGMKMGTESLYKECANHIRDIMNIYIYAFGKK